jgi:hypothetical protein
MVGRASASIEVDSFSRLVCAPKEDEEDDAGACVSVATWDADQRCIAALRPGAKFEGCLIYVNAESGVAGCLMCSRECRRNQLHCEGTFLLFFFVFNLSLELQKYGTGPTRLPP